MIEAYILHLLILICIYVILSLGLNLSMGYTGLFNLGHAAFFGIGAYISALLALNLGVPFWLSLPLGGLVAAFFGLILVYPTSKLRGDYLALATLGFVVIVESVFRNWTDVTRGPLGLPGIPKPELFSFTFSSLHSYFILALVFALIACLVIKRLVDSPFGRVLKAIRDDEVAAATVGKNVLKYKTLALVVSAFFGGVAGSLYAHYITFIDPTSFTIMESILIITMIIIGGLASIRGSIAGAAIIILLPEPLRFLPIPSFAVGALRMMIYAAVLVAVIMRRPRGIFGESSLKEEVHAA